MVKENRTLQISYCVFSGDTAAMGDYCCVEKVEAERATN